MSIDLSIIVPGIRPYNWQRLYESVLNSTNKTWEMIFVGPYSPPDYFNDLNNILYIEDWGSPIRAQQIGLTHCKGEWISWMADDGVFLPNGLTLCFEQISLIKDKYKEIIMCKYHEGDKYNPEMLDNKYYTMGYHPATSSRYMPPHYFILMEGIIYRDLLLDMGGWDCQFEACPMSYADLGFRLQNSGVRFHIPNDFIVSVGHMPGVSGDHGPIYYAQTFHDEPLYHSIFDNQTCLQRNKIDINNWINTPNKWTRRFH